MAVVPTVVPTAETRLVVGLRVDLCGAQVDGALWLARAEIFVETPGAGGAEPTLRESRLRPSLSVAVAARGLPGWDVVSAAPGSIGEFCGVLALSSSLPPDLLAS